MLERFNWETCGKKSGSQTPPPPALTELSRHASDTRSAASFNKLPPNLSPESRPLQAPELTVSRKKNPHVHALPACHRSVPGGGGFDADALTSQLSRGAVRSSITHAHTLQHTQQREPEPGTRGVRG